MKSEDFRTVKTGITATECNMDMFNSVIGQLSDGIWENSNMDGYWMYADVHAEDGDIVINIDKTGGDWYQAWNRQWRYRKNRWHGMTDIQVVKYFTEKINYIYHLELKDKGIKDLDEKSMYLGYNSGVTFNQAKALVKYLRRVIREAEREGARQVA